MTDTPMADAAKKTAKIVKLDAAQSLAHQAKAKAKKETKAKEGEKKTKKKRKAGDAGSDDDNEDDSGSDVDFVDVDLDFHGFIELDFQSLKHLLTQLFSHDAKEMDVPAIADHFLELEEDVGSCVKADGEQSDPLAFIGALPWQSDLPYIKTLHDYIVSKSSKSPELLALLKDSTKKIGIVLQERLVNMPAQIVPPLFRILGEEMDQAGPSFAFTHLLVLSRTFVASDSETMDTDAAPTSVPTKKKKKSKNTSSAPQQPQQTFYYHLEDEVLSNLAEAWTEFEYSNAPQRGTTGGDEDFGVHQKGRVMLIKREKLAQVVKDTETLLGTDVKM